MKKIWNVRDLCQISVFVALTAIMAQISIPMPFGMYMTMQTFAVSLGGMVLGAKRGATAVFVYLLLGAVGVPVFASFRGGLQQLGSPPGGFLRSFPLMT